MVARSKAVRMPSPTNSQRIAKAPITGVTMNGSNETNTRGPRTARSMLLTASAITMPNPTTSGRVMNVKVSVKRSARQKSRPATAAQPWPPGPKAAASFSTSSTRR